MEQQFKKKDKPKKPIKSFQDRLSDKLKKK